MGAAENESVGNDFYYDFEGEDGSDSDIDVEENAGFQGILIVKRILHCQENTRYYYQSKDHHIKFLGLTKQHTRFPDWVSIFEYEQCSIFIFSLKALSSFKRGSPIKPPQTHPSPCTNSGPTRSG